MAITSEWPLSLLPGIAQKKASDFEFPASCTFQELNTILLSTLHLMSLKDSETIHLWQVHSLITRFIRKDCLPALLIKPLRSIHLSATSALSRKCKD